jgi:hypothetical protein
MGIVYFLLAVLQLVCAVWLIRQLRQSYNHYNALAAITVIMLVYDNLVVASGGLLGEGDLLKTLNVLRYYGHALLTPTMIIFAFGVARRLGFRWAQSKVSHAIFCLLATLLIVYGAVTDILRLDLVIADEFGVLRYVNQAEAILKGPPLAPVVTIVVVIAVGFMMWRRQHAPWMLVGSALMFVAAGAGISMPVLGNVGEVAMAGGLVSGEQEARKAGG